MYATLVDAGTLARHAGDPDWVVFDCRHDLGDPAAGARAFAAGHIPGARFAPLDTALAGRKTGSNGRHPLPDPAAWLDFLRDAGVSDETQIVAYDADNGMYAARLWWLARWIGHEQVAVLDGGLAAWRELGQEMSTVVPTPRRGAIERRPALAATVDAAQLEADLAAQHWQVIDARAPERYRGDVEPLDRVAGHIPKALNRPFAQNLTEGRFKTPTVLAAEWRALLKDRSPAEIVHQCGSGVSACHNLLAMAVAGLPGALLYPGSWSEWCSDPKRPVATGAQP